MAKEDIILRSTVNAPLTTKGSALTHAQFDANWIEIYNALVSLSQSSYVSAYNAAITYDDTILNYVTYSSQIWKMINATPQVNVTPGTDANTWVKVYATDLIGKSPFLYETKVTLTANQINSGFSVPIQLITAKGAGFFIEPISGAVKFNYGTIPFDATTAYIRTAVGTNVIATISNINGTADFFRTANTTSGDIIENKAIEIYFNADGSSSPLGDSTIDIYLTYKITAI
jgi:hypothetical protein